MIHCCSKFKLNPVRRCEEGETKEEDTMWSIPDKRVSKNYENVTFVNCESRETYQNMYKKKEDINKKMKHRRVMKVQEYVNENK